MAFALIIVAIPVLLLIISIILFQFYPWVVTAHIMFWHTSDEDTFLNWLQFGIDNGFKGNNILQFNNNQLKDLPFLEDKEIDEIFGKEQSKEDPNTCSYTVNIKNKNFIHVMRVCHEYNINSTYQLNNTISKYENNKDEESLNDLLNARLYIHKQIYSKKNK